MKTLAISSLRVRLTLLIVLCLLPILGLTVFTYLRERHLALNHIEHDVQMISDFASSTQERLIETTRQLLLAISKIPEMKNLDERKCSSCLSEILSENPVYINIGAVLPDGNPFCSGAPIARPIDLSDQLWFQSSVANRDFAISSYQTLKGLHKPALYFGYPVFHDSGRLQAVLFAAVDRSLFDRFALQVHLPRLSEILMVSSSGNILAYSAGPERAEEDPLPDRRIIDAILSKGKGVVEIDGLDGVTRLYAFTPLSSTVETGLYVSIAIPKALVYGEVNEVLRDHFIGLGLITILALWAMWIGSNAFIIRPVNVLADTAQQLSSGELGIRTGLPHGEGELNRLAESFDHMVDALERRAEQLRAAEARYRVLVEQLPVITYAARPDEFRSTLYISPQVKDILGFTQDEWMADERLWISLIHPEDVEEVVASFTNYSAGRQPLRSEYRIYSKDGTLLWVNDEAVSVRGGGDSPYLQGIIRDITAHRQAEESLLEYQEQLRSLASELTMAEERERRRIAVDLHDRVGQSLALSRIRLGLLKELAAGSEYAEPVEEIRKLIIEAIQDTRSLIFKISSPILYELGIEAALEWLAEQTQKEHAIEVHCETDGQEKLLDNDVKAFLFRAVSELLVNVTKHSRARHAGITVGSDGRCIRISVWDDGLGFVSSKPGHSWSTADGFGLFSIRERLDHGGGSMEVESKPGEGTRITLVAPLKPGAGSR